MRRREKKGGRERRPTEHLLKLVVVDVIQALVVVVNFGPAVCVLLLPLLEKAAG